MDSLAMSGQFNLARVDARIDRREVALFVGAAMLLAMVAVLIGKKTGWDLFNYHWYNPYALLEGRFGFDVAVGHHATYYNPLPDLPLFLIGSHGPAWLGGVLMGALAGIAVALIGALAYRSLPIVDERWRAFASVGIALLSVTGAGAFQEIGDPANDIPAGIGIFASLLLVVSKFETVRLDTIGREQYRVLLLAGLCAGAAVGLKLTTAVYGVGLVGALCAISGSARVRLSRCLIFGVASLSGMLLTGGFWMWEMWQFSGNPFFPYFNDLFRSPMLTEASYRDPNFRPANWLEAAFFPFYFTADSRHVSESVFRDARILVLYVLIPLAGALSLWRRVNHKESLQIGPRGFLMWFAVITYFAWLAIFDIYRYLIPLEMLAPLLIVLALWHWPLKELQRIAICAVVLGVLQAVVRVDLSDRQSWQGRYVEVSTPPLPNDKQTMILMTGHAPMAYVIPSFPDAIPFLRIDGWLVHGSDRVTGLAKNMRERVSKHAGSLYLLFAPNESEAAAKAARDYDLNASIDSASCLTVTSNIDKPLWLCPASKPQRRVEASVDSE
jgi:hypothetical protein